MGSCQKYVLKEEKILFVTLLCDVTEISLQDITKSNGLVTRKENMMVFGSHLHVQSFCNTQTIGIQAIKPPKSH